MYRQTIMRHRARHWASINEVSFIFGMKLLFRIYRLFGKWPFRCVLYPVLLWYVATNRRARKASMQYLNHVRAYAADVVIPRGISGVFSHFAAFAESILDKMLLWGGLFKLDHIQHFGQQHILDNARLQRGGLIICTHLGNLELCRVISKRASWLKMTVLVHTKHAQAFNRLLAELDPHSQLNLMQVTEISPATAMELVDKVSRGEFVVIAGDRVPVSPNPRVAHADFLGASAPFPVGPYVLASLLKCPVYLMFSLRTKLGAEIYFEPFRDAIELPRKHRNSLLDELIADYASRLEHYCLRAPLQWFNFYDFWTLPEAHENVKATIKETPITSATIVTKETEKPKEMHDSHH
jgi:predicted LPLAT superfamily acyltransferase